MPLILALGRQGQADLCEFEASLVYRASSRTGSKATETLSRKNKKQTTKPNKQTKKQNKTWGLERRDSLRALAALLEVRS